MTETIIESVLKGKVDIELLKKWLNDENIEDAPDDCILLCCTRSDFVAYFLSYLRNQTDGVLQTSSYTVPVLQQQTPDKLLNTRRKHRRSISDPTNESDRTNDSLTVKTDRNRSQESPGRDKKRLGRRVKTKLFPEDKSNQSVSSDESRISLGVDQLTVSSTPLKNGSREFPSFSSSPVTPQSRSFKDIERCDTPRMYRHSSRSYDKSLSLGDFLVNAQPKGSKKKRSGKNLSNESEDTPNLDLSNSEMFPEIGARKASSLKSDKRRIKPTNLNISARKSFSLTSFNSECFQQNSPMALEENSAFKLQNVQTKESGNSFEAERNILKQERHKLMEKFNILNTATSPKTVVTPQIKIMKKDSLEIQNFTNTDPSRIVHKDKIDVLVDIYEVLIKNNLVFSVVTELYFLITIIQSKQLEEDYSNIESKLDDNKYCDYLLKSINNSTYFATKSLWHQRSILEIILDKNSLKTLGENKKVRGFYPDLAKFLLNSYGLKCEADLNQEKAKTAVLEERPSNGIVCFNFETDNADNFPSVLSFQNFKKQRDMFYEIVRWYQETHTSTTSLTSLRARTKTLLCSGVISANVQRLAGLFVTHMLAECCVTAQESKLSKLQRRLTCPSAPESHRLPHFSTREMFYKEFILCTDNESFRSHLKDALASEIIALDATHIANDERGNSNSTETLKDFVQLSKKLSLLSKFLGYVTSLPYWQVSAELTAKTQAHVNQDFSTNVKEKVLVNSVGLRDYSQPCLDIKTILENAIQNGRLIISVPWIVQYLSMLDYTTLRIKYYQNLIKILLKTYTYLLKGNSLELNKHNVLYLKIKLGWLYDLPHFPHEPNFDGQLSVSTSAVSDVNIDSLDLIDEWVLIELCPHLKDLNVLLSSCRVVGDQKEMGSFRHITPVSLSLNAEDRIRNKEKELQARLEEEFLKSQPSSTRRVVELVVERVTSGAVREAGTETLSRVREQARARVVAAVRVGQPTLESVQDIYTEHLNQLVQEATEIGETKIKNRAWKAVQALLPSAPLPLRSVVVKACRVRLKAWIREHWNTTAILCKDIESELKTLQSLGDMATVPINPVNANAMVQELMLPSEQFDVKHVSVANVIIALKEQIYLLSSRKPTALSPVLSSVPAAVSADNLFCKPNARTAVFQLTIDLCLVYVSRKPNELTEEFLNQLHTIWNTCCPVRKKNTPQELDPPERRYEISPDLRNFTEEDRLPTPVSDDEIQVNLDKIIIVNQPLIDTTKLLTSPSQAVLNNSLISVNQSLNSNNQSFISGNQSLISVNQSLTSVNQTGVERSEETEMLQFFDRVLCPRNIVLLSDTKCKASDVWSAMGQVLVFLLKNDYFSEDSLTEQCLAVYRQDWPQPILENLSTCMKLVSSQWSHSSTGKFTLFLDFLAEFCGDMDYDPM